MSLFLPVQRATLLIPTGETDQTKHLFIILTNPSQIDGFDSPHSLLVGIGSIYPDRPHDPTCRLYAGDHPFIRHDSYVNYYRARIEETRKLTEGCNAGLLVPRDILDEAIFARVCDGLMNSRHTALKHRLFFEAATTH